MEDREKLQTSVCTVGNAIDVIARVILNIAGNDISSRVGGSNMTLKSIKELAVARINLNLGKKV